jgi:putative component of toxin-antitoxin plasmid stabilization module
VTPIFDGHDNVCTVTGPNGRDEACDFLTTLVHADQGKFHRYLEYLRDGRHVKSPENMRHIKGVTDPHDMGAEVHELKVHRSGGLRLYLVRYNDRWYATHGVRKVSDKQVPKQAAKAYQIFWND